MPVRIVHTLRVPASLVSDDGELEVRFINVNPDNPEGTFPASAIFSGEVVTITAFSAGADSAWTRSAGALGWVEANPGRLEIRSLILGLYFMVQEPRG